MLKQRIMVVVIALLILGSAGSVVVSTLVFNSKEGAGSTGGHNNITFTDAVMTCRQRVKKEFGGDLKNLVTDSHSSRFEDRVFQYKIFLQADVFESSASRTFMHYVNCFVKGRNGRIAKFEALKDKDNRQGGSVSRGGDSNAFGWPVRL